MNIRRVAVSVFLGISVAGSALAEDALRTKAKQLFEPIPETAPGFSGRAASQLTIALGKMLYFDPRLSQNRDISCNSCHNISMGGANGDLAPSLDHGGQLGGRKVPTVLNAVFNKSQFWDGRASDLEDHVANSVMVNPRGLLRGRGGAMPIGARELEIAKERTVELLKAIPGYVDAFQKAFPGESEPVSYKNVARAIAAFESTLTTPDAPFDLWLKGDDSALSQEQKEGLRTFIDKDCASCHNGMNIGGAQFARFGLVQSPGPELLPPEDWGRFAITRDVKDKYVFKVPGLRNVELTAPYFHSRTVRDLREAVAVMGTSQLGQRLNDRETDALASFLKSLTGRQPQVVLPILPASATPQPASPSQ